MTDVTISREEIRDIFYRMGWKPEDAETFIRLRSSEMESQ